MKRVLLIEDDRTLRRGLRALLEVVGYEVVEADNGREGVHLHRLHPVDLVVTDLIMPEQEGIETIRQLRAEFPGVPIVAVSGGGRIGPETYLALALRVGAVRALAKPFSRREFLDAITEAAVGPAA